MTWKGVYVWLQQGSSYLGCGKRVGIYLDDLEVT